MGIKFVEKNREMHFKRILGRIERLRLKERGVMNLGGTWGETMYYLYRHFS